MKLIHFKRFYLVNQFDLFFFIAVSVDGEVLQGWLFSDEIGSFVSEANNRSFHINAVNIADFYIVVVFVCKFQHSFVFNFDGKKPIGSKNFYIFNDF